MCVLLSQDLWLGRGGHGLEDVEEGQCQPVLLVVLGEHALQVLEEIHRLLHWWVAAPQVARVLHRDNRTIVLCKYSKTSLHAIRDI